MAQLVQMRGRIRAVETIEKITHAMRLIAMSSHTRTQNVFKSTRIYTGAMKNITMRLHRALGSEQFLSLLPFKQTGKTLIIVIGSQKGLCGNFNTLLFSFFEEKTPSLNLASKDVSYIAVGTKAVEFVRSYTQQDIIGIEKFSPSTLSYTCQTIFDLIYEKPSFKRVIIFANENASFFSHVPRMHDLYEYITMQPEQAMPGELTWYEPARVVAQNLARSYIHSILRLYLLESLVSESAARFVSMDNATRNAEQILEDARMTYNKLRQTKITKELSELAATL